uniref:CCR4-NOT transcription complex subunit 1 HEAT repeat domain-containing protein n=1 Tax=Megaselia scalaris TaxID=36166 RepID=T1GX42_MEGSC
MDEKLYWNYVNEEFGDQSNYGNILVKFIKGNGYEFTASVDECKNHLKCGGNELQPADIAKIISFMCKTHSSLNDGNANNLPTPGTVWSAKNASSNNNSESSSEKPESGTEQQQQSTENKQPEESGNTDSTVANSGSGGNNSPTWKPEVFVQAVKEILPNIVWKDVCVQLDNKEFFIRDRQGLNLLLTVFRLGTGSNLFPTELIYRHWQNVIGQLSLITIILKNPDLFSFADYIFTPAPVEVLKTPPENENKEIATWKSLHLVDALLYIADHQPQTQQCYRQVHEIFSFPVKQCPDVLFMALLQISPPLTSLRIELISFKLGNYTPTCMELYSSTSVATINYESMSDCYLRSDCDQTKLSRILDVAQDLKALSSLLNARSFMFVIDLACLASRREYLKLEKWLSDKIREHGEQFVQAIVKFLQRRCPQIMGKNDDQQLMIPKSVQLPLETVTTMVACLQSCANNVQQELCDLIMQMSNYCNILTKQARQQPPPTGVPPLTATTTTPGPAASNLNLMRQQPGPPGPGQHHQNPSGPPFNPQIFGNVGLGGAGLGGAGLGGALGGMGVNVG